MRDSKKSSTPIKLALTFALAVTIAVILIQNRKSPTQNQQTVTIGNSNNGTSVAVVNGSNNQATINRSISIAQTNAGVIQGQINAPAQHITLTQIFNNYSTSSVPDTGLRGWVSNLDARLSTNTSDLRVTREELVSLTKLLAKLDERTSDMERLPDGQTRFGQIIAGTPVVVVADLTNAANKFNAGDYSGSLKLSQNGIDVMNASVRSNILSSEITLTPKGKGNLYYGAAASAQRLLSNSLADDFAHKAVESDPSPKNKELLVSTLFNLARADAEKNAYSNAFVLVREAITNHESIEAHDVVLAKNDVLRLYALGMQAALITGETNFLLKYSDRLQNLAAEVYQDSVTNSSKEEVKK